jgi:phosphatidylglycerophosphatase A
VRHAITFLATGAYVGLLPVAPGTFGSALAIPLLLVLARFHLPAAAVVALIAGFAGLAMIVCQLAGVLYAQADSSKIVLDEVCGMLVAGALIAPSAPSLALAFLLFRVFDIVKPFPASYFDRRIKNGIGVVADDLVAGLYANLLVRVVM